MPLLKPFAEWLKCWGKSTVQTTQSYYMEDPLLGRIYLKPHAAARKYIFRYRGEALHITIPPYVTEKEVKEVIEQNRKLLQDIVDKGVENHLVFTVGDAVSTLIKPILLQAGRVARFVTEEQADQYVLFCPPQYNYQLPGVQQAIIRSIKNLLRKEAAVYFPPIVAKCSNALGLQVSRITIGSGRRILGHCNRKGEITLSLYLFLMPQCLVEYVVLHELAHLTHFNHSPEFHQLLNEYCGGKEKDLERMLKQFKFPFE